MYHKLQYISQGAGATEHIGNIRRALDGGCRWIQLRMKKFAAAQTEVAAAEVRQLCDRYQAVFIVNDQPQIAANCGADGVHLGLTDMPVAEARQILGPGKIIGGTANTLAQVQQRLTEKCDYIGLGPFRFTSTKENLSPVLGLEGYKTIVGSLQTSIPIYAIGGIRAEDVADIISTGIYGVAVSGVITGSPDYAHTIQQLNKQLYETIENSR